MIDTVTTEDKLVSIDAVAKNLDISVRQVWRLIARGEMPKPIKIGRSSKLFLSDIEAYMAKLRAQRN